MLTGFATERTAQSTMSPMEEILRKRFTPNINEALIKIFQRAYEANSECYDPFIGHDSMVYGLMIHKSAKYFIKNLAAQELWVDIIQYNPRFLFRINDFLISAYRVGDSLETDIATAFPTNCGGAPKLAEANQRQLLFPFMKNGTRVLDDSNCRNLILAHTGNQNDGLCRLFWGMPSAIDDAGRISAWSSTCEIWRREDLNRAVPLGPIPPASKPPIERVTPVTLSLKKRQKIQRK
jgi:hypothetical protein